MSAKSDKAKKKAKAAAKRRKAAAVKPAPRELTGDELPDYSIKVNGQPIAVDATVMQGDTLTISVPSWPGFWLNVDAYGAGRNGFSTPYANAGVYSLKVTLDVGDRYYQPVKADGSEEFAFRLKVVDRAKPVEQKPAPQAINKLDILTPTDKAGAMLEHVPDGDYPYAIDVKAGASLSNLTLHTVPRPDPTKANPFAGVLMSGDNGTLTNLTLADKSGWGVKVNGSGCAIRNLAASTFTDYAVYAESVRGLTINGVKIVGGSTSESCLRFDDCTDVTIRDVFVDYTTATRKACLRGSMTGTVSDSHFRGGVVGVNPLGGMDGGQALGITKFQMLDLKTGKWIYVDAPAEKVAACLAVVGTATGKAASGVAALCAAAAGLSIAPNEIAVTLASRAANLPKRSDVDWQNVTIEHSIRWEPGTTYRFNGGTIDGTLNGGNCFAGDIPRSTYPQPGYVLPGDAMRSAPSIVFTGTTFIGNVDRTLAGVVFEGCTFK